MKKFILLFLAFTLALACQRSHMIQNQAVGYAQGTTYQIKYITPKKEDWQSSFDSIFITIDNSMSTYVDSSTISVINRGDTMVTVDPLFENVLGRSLEVAGETGGKFDPTVGPLVHHWGFGKEAPADTNEAKIAGLLQSIGYEKVRQSGSAVGLPAGFRLDFNAIAQGYTVDVISNYLEKRGVKRYMVEVGGEVKARGTNIDGKIWRIGVDKPTEELDRENRFQFIVGLKDKALATSGNYRKFWVDEKTGVKYSHTIDPNTGYPARNRLLSVSIIADQCMDADAYATACMVMGQEDAWRFVKSKPDLEAYFISSDDEGNWQIKFTEGFESYILR